MAGLVSKRLSSPTHALIGAVRHRVWLQSTVNAISRDVRLSGGVLLAGGLYHLFVHALRTGPVVTLALLPLAAGLFYALFRRRPEPAAAARSADIWFDGKNLITSAWELLRRRGDHSPVDQLVVARAHAAAEQWRKRIAAQRPLRWPYRISTPLLLALTGVLLLQLPSKEWLARFHDAQSVRIAARDSGLRPGKREGNTAEHSPPPSPLARANPDSVPAQTMSGKPPQDASFTINDSSAPQTSEAGDQNAAKNAAATPFAKGASPPANSGGRLAGDQGGIRPNHDIRTESASFQVNEVGIQRAAGNQGNSGKGDELGEAGRPAAPATADTMVIPAARQARTAYRGDYSPALKTYMARYFQELGLQESPP